MITFENLKYKVENELVEIETMNEESLFLSIKKTEEILINLKFKQEYNEKIKNRIKAEYYNNKINIQKIDNSLLHNEQLKEKLLLTYKNIQTNKELLLKKHKKAKVK